MSVDYRLAVRRKNDDKILGVVDCNQIKGVLDYPKFARMIGCDSRYNSNKVTFGYDDLESIENEAYDEIDSIISKIIEKKMMIATAKSVEVLEHLEEDLSYIKSEELKEVKYVIDLVGEIKGMVLAITQDLYQNPVLNFEEDKDYDDETSNVPAYKYNAVDLPNGEKQYTYMYDVYFQLEMSC